MARLRLWSEPTSTRSEMPHAIADAMRSVRVRHLAAGTAVTGGLLVGCGLLLEATGGGDTPFVHLLYVPVIAAAATFRAWGGLAVGLLAGIISAPAVTGAVEPGGSWALRALIFAGIGWAFGKAHQKLQKRMSQTNDLVKKISTVHARTLSTFASTVDLRDKPTSGHSSRVAHNARAIGMALGLAQETLRAVYWAGLLHDLGKIAIPERILQKPASLTADEVVTMRRHSDVGANLLMSVSADLRQIADGVRSHHERWDGSGYPRRMSGQEIPLAGRIVSIVDVFEALTCSRPYRQPQPVAEVLEFIRFNDGKWFDPELVPLLEDLYWKGDIYTAASAETQLPVEEAPMVITTDAAEESILRATIQPDYHLGSSGRP